MIADCVSNMVLWNGKMVDANSVSIPKDAVVIYDVLRVMDTVPLYLEDHSERFFKSFTLSGREIPFAENVFADSICEFIKQTALIEGNIRCVYSISEETQFMVYEIKHSYPTAEMYAQGVECGTFQGERANPNVKQEAAVKTNAYKKIAETGVYEVLLVDMQDNVTEGSKSNTFFVKNGTVVTALAEDVLCGITRLQILDIIRELQIPLEERKIALCELADFDAAFVSGTSPKVLPISAIEDRKYDVANPIVKRIAQAYDAQIAKYIVEHKK
ncbi:MAG: aminotransferase class IV [Bacteroidales bacterium]|nr:aminotransferase class IV [Bacteroidales bacterium]